MYPREAILFWNETRRKILARRRFVSKNAATKSSREKNAIFY